jgi:hypothetical protein
LSRCPGLWPMAAYRSSCSATHQEDAMSTFITKLDTSGTGTRLAVKDLIDVRGPDHRRVPRGGTDRPGTHLPASLQLVGPSHGEELLLSTALRIQAAIA